MSRSAGRRTPLAARLFALAVVLLASASQLSSSLHNAFVEHELCAEHGELVHGELTSQVAPRAEAPDVVTGVEEISAHGHDHCLVAALQQSASLAPLSPSPKVAWPPSVERPVASAVEQSPHAPLARAPKGSPPV